MAAIFDIQRFSLFDGPGIRTAVFFKGCPLDCLWCHNPESKSPLPQLLYLPRRCVGCGACADICPNGAHTLADGVHLLDRSRCTDCGVCAAVCPAGALRMAGQEMSVGQIMGVIRADRPFYEFGGGVTLTGGEPLLQPDEAGAVLQACRDEGIHTAVETCGFVSDDAIKNAARLSDLILFDLKHPESEIHRKYTGQGNERILASLKAASAAGAALWIRIPFIPGVNSGREAAEGFARIIGKTSGVECVEVLPYHRMGASKCAALGVPDPAEHIPAPDGEEILQFARLLEAGGREVRILA